MTRPLVPVEVAERLARDAVLTTSEDPDLAGLATARAGSPMIVHTPRGEPSYWLVPLRVDHEMAGFVRVTAAGDVAAVGRYRTPPDLDESHAKQVASRLLRDNEKASDPILVHDGPPGREAWLMETSLGGEPHRWIFVTEGGTYDRPAGEPHDDSLEG